MALSPLKAPSLSGPRRRGSGAWTPLILGLAGTALLYWLFQLAFGFDRKVTTALSAARQGRLAEAESKLIQLESKKPGDPRLDDIRAALANRGGKSEEAAQAYAKSEGAGLDGKWSDWHIEEGDEYLSRGNYTAAKVEFDHAAALDPRAVRALQGQAVCAHASGHVAKAYGLYQKVLAQDPGYKPALEGLKKARESRDRGVMYYMFDRNQQPLARVAISNDSLGLRSYPHSQHTAHITGVLSEKFGDLGLEGAFKGLLPGLELELTLDMRIQDAAQKALGWRKGSIVVLNPTTGEILAAVSQPSFKPEEIDRRPSVVRENYNRPLLNRAFDGLYEPGSICKIITAAAALEANVDMSRLFPMNPDTAIRIDGKVFRDWEDHGKIRSLKEAMDVSSNIALARVAFAMGPDVLFEYINRFGFNQPFELMADLKGLGPHGLSVTSSRAPLRADSQYALAERACGLGREYRITPLHAALLAATIANKGVMMKPKLIKEVRNLASQPLYEFKPETQREIMKPETAEKIRQIMMDAVEGDRGIGKKARVSGIAVAGKTGTARTRSGASSALDAWFICFAPADKPQYAIAVLGDGEGTGMSIAAPIAGVLLRELMR